MLQSSGCAIGLLSQKADNLQFDDLSRHKKYSRVETTLNTKVDMGYEDLSDQKIFIRWAKNVPLSIAKYHLLLVAPGGSLWWMVGGLGRRPLMRR